MKIEHDGVLRSLNRSFLIAAVALGVGGCGGSVEGEEAQTPPTVAESNLRGAPFFMGQWWDQSGDVHIAAWTSEWVNGFHNEAECKVPDGWLLVGGGAEVNNNNALLHASFPDGINQKWIARSKDHGIQNYHALKAWCIGLQLNGLSYTVLRQNTHYSEPVTSGTGHDVSATATVSDGDVMVGGGARTNWTGSGMLLYQSEGAVFFGGVGGAWYASAKDHFYPEYQGSVSAYAIGISRCPSGWGGKCLSARADWYSGSPDGTGWQSFSASETGAYALSNVGGLATYGIYGRLLTLMTVFNLSGGRGGGVVASKDHIAGDSGHVVVNMIAIKRD